MLYLGLIISTCVLIRVSVVINGVFSCRMVKTFIISFELLFCIELKSAFGIGIRILMPDIFSPGTLVAPWPNSELINHPSLNYTYTKSM